MTACQINYYKFYEISIYTYNATWIFTLFINVYMGVFMLHFQYGITDIKHATKNYKHDKIVNYLRVL